MGALRPEEVIHFEVGFPQDRAERSLRHIFGVMGNGYLSSGRYLPPNLMASGPVAVELEPEFPQSSDDVAVLESGQSPH